MGTARLYHNDDDDDNDDDDGDGDDDGDYGDQEIHRSTRATFPCQVPSCGGKSI